MYFPQQTVLFIKKQPKKILYQVKHLKFVLQSNIVHIKMVKPCSNRKFFTWVFFHKHSRFRGRGRERERTAGEGGGYFLQSSLLIPPASKILKISRAITADNLCPHTASSLSRSGSSYFPYSYLSASR